MNASQSATGTTFSNIVCTVHDAGEAKQQILVANLFTVCLLSRLGVRDLFAEDHVVAGPVTASCAFTLIDDGNADSAIRSWYADSVVLGCPARTWEQGHG